METVHIQLGCCHMAAGLDAASLQDGNESEDSQGLISGPWSAQVFNPSGG